MVLSLPLPSFSRSTPTTPPLRPVDSNNGNNTNTNPNPNPARPHRASTGQSTGGGRTHLWKTSGILTSSAAGNPSSSTLSEALRNNPFGSGSISSRSRDAVEGASSEQGQEQEELNRALETLALVFPDVKIEVFRELLVRFDGVSRLQVCVEQLLRHKQEWVAGRWNVEEGGGGGGTGNDDDHHHDNHAGGIVIMSGSPGDRDSLVVPIEERFRSEEYRETVRAVLGREFNGLSRSTVDAVLAEANFCYMRARPTLRDLSRKTWRATFNSIFPSFKRKKDKDDHPLVVWQRYSEGEVMPRLKETGCKELDGELYDALVSPLLQQKREEQEDRGFRLAEELNENEAKAAGALYECECCLGDMTFEQISSCSASSHIICYSCIQRTIHEALFGQGWGKSVDVERSTLRCLAPVTHGTCEGSLHPEIVKRAVVLDRAGLETFRKFEDRIVAEALFKSQLKLIRCPFCSYAEVDPVYHPPAHGITWHFRQDGLLSTILMTVFLLDLIPLLIIPIIIIYLLDPSAPTAVWKNALQHLCLKIRPKRFICSSPSCRRVSCITCQKQWRDPHICHEPLLLDLRATVEAARTAAVKRTCPRCSLSFVKSSGCNKLTCVCGYSMCYLCRKALGPPLDSTAQAARRRPRRRAGPVNQENRPQINGMEDDNNEDENYPFYDNPVPPDPEEAEGYKHFCEHFRINPGSRCTECNKCDLYQAEDEEAVARRAGEKAEREWRTRQGMSGLELVSGAARHVNHDFSTAAAGGGGGRLQGSSGPSSWAWDIGPSRVKNWRYWVEEVWRDGQWKLEGQAFADWVVERVVVIEEI